MARVIARYDLLGVPVVDSENRLVGLVTVDDVIDVIHEEQAEDFSEMAGANVEEFEEEEGVSWRAALSRLTWLSVNVLAGFILALVLYQVLGPMLLSAFPASASLIPIGHVTPDVLGALRSGLRSRLALSSIVYLLPMLLLTSGSMGTQALGIAGWQLRTSRGRDLWRGLFRELQLGTLGGVLASIVTGLLTWLLLRSPLLAVATGLGFGFTLLIAAICGIVLPNLFHRLRLRGSLVSAPLLDPIIGLISVLIFLAVTLSLINLLHAGG